MRMLMEKNNARLAALRSTDEEINGLIRCLMNLKTIWNPGTAALLPDRS